MVVDIIDKKLHVYKLFMSCLSLSLNKRVWHLGIGAIMSNPKSSNRRGYNE